MKFVEFPIASYCISLLIVSAVAHSVSLFVFALRFYSRLVTKIRPGLEDLFTFLGLAAATLIFVLFTFVLRSGLGHPVEETLINFGFIGKANFVNEILYGLGIVSSRLGVLTFYLRAFPTPRLQLAIKVFMAVSSVLVAAVGLWDIFTCQPVALNWDLGLKGSCGDRLPPYATAAAVSIASDIIALTLLLPIIWGLNTNLKNKLSLTALFIVGLSTVGIAIWRLIALQSNVPDVRPLVIATAILEIDLIAICSSVPIIYPLYSIYCSCRSSRPRSRQQSRVSSIIRSIAPFKSRRPFNPIEDIPENPSNAFELNYLSHPRYQEEQQLRWR